MQMKNMKYILIIFCKKKRVLYLFPLYALLSFIIQINIDGTVFDTMTCHFRMRSFPHLLDKKIKPGAIKHMNLSGVPTEFHSDTQVKFL
jgi:hypothetical protein